MQIIPRLAWYGQWGVQALVEMTLGLLTNGASRNDHVSISSHLRPIKVLSQDVNGLIKTKMTSQAPP